MNIGHAIFEWLGEPSIISRILSVGWLILVYLFRRLQKKYNQIIESIEKSKDFVDKETVNLMLKENKKETLQIINERLNDVKEMIKLVK